MAHQTPLTDPSRDPLAHADAFMFFHRRAYRLHRGFVGFVFIVTLSVAFSALFTSLLAVTKYPAKKQLRGGAGCLWFTEQETQSVLVEKIWQVAGGVKGDLAGLYHSQYQREGWHCFRDKVSCMLLDLELSYPPNKLPSCLFLLSSEVTRVHHYNPAKLVSNFFQ